ELPPAAQDLFDFLGMLGVVGHRGPNLLHRKVRQGLVADPLKIAPVEFGVAGDVMDRGPRAFDRRVTRTPLGIADHRGRLIDAAKRLAQPARLADEAQDRVSRTVVSRATAAPTPPTRRP